MQKCIEEKILNSTEKRAVSAIVVDYLLNVLKTTKRRVASEIAKKICDKFPKWFADSINYHETWGCGHGTFFLSIYNSLLYQKAKIDSSKRAGKKRGLLSNADSDDEAESQRIREKDLREKQDIYGCINYAPLLTDDETQETQAALRIQLVQLYSTDKNDKNIGSLMQKTYPTLRAVINDPNVDLLTITQNWPFLQEVEHFVAHSNYLLGDDLTKKWTDSIENRMKITGQYLKSLKLNSESKSQVDRFVDEAKSACIIRKDRIPKHLVVFKLLMHYFKENENFLFKVKQVSLNF